MRSNCVRDPLYSCTQEESAVIGELVKAAKEEAKLIALAPLLLAHKQVILD